MANESSADLLRPCEEVLNFAGARWRRESERERSAAACIKGKLVVRAVGVTTAAVADS